MAVTIYDLAKAADCSISTVSKVLNDSYTVSEATKERIRTLAEEMGYRPNERARSFARKKNGTVLFAANLSRGVGFENPHLFEIVTGVERYLDEKGYSLILKHVEKSSAPDQIRSLMHSEQADGVILHAGILTRQLATVLVKESLPHLVIGKPDFTSQLSWMDISHEAAGQIAANYLLDKGYRRILYLMGDKQEDTISARRLDGLLAALEGYHQLREKPCCDGRDPAAGDDSGGHSLYQQLSCHGLYAEHPCKGVDDSQRHRADDL